MYEIVVTQHLDSAHYLRGYKGKCEKIHGHRYAVTVHLQSSILNEIGLVYDFTDVKQHLSGILSRLDHVLLNEVSPFDQINPSAENIAHSIYNELKVILTGKPVIISAVEVWETPQQGIIYTPD
jgi:6-pyruvoyltetrahydropterin/6-carboxytetrahydropterin synthase